MTECGQVAIIILTWNGKADTLACLASLQEVDYPNCMLIVVDNGSSDGTSEAVRKGFSDVTLIEVGANLGYAEGNNVGIRHALNVGAAFVLLLNNDTVVASDFVTKLVEADSSYPGAGVFGPKIYYHDAPRHIWCAGNCWTGWRSGFRQVGDGEPDGPAFTREEETDYIIGCALFARRHVFETVGLLDPQFFLTYEETDWCYRARQKGFRCMVIPDSKIWHKVAVSMGGTGSPLQEYFYMRNYLLWAERHLERSEHRSLFGEMLRYAMGFSNERGAGMKAFYWNLCSSWSRVRGATEDGPARARFLGLRDYLLRRFGDCPEEVRRLRRATPRTESVR